MQASEQVVEAAGGAWCASLNHYALGDGRLVTTQQVDEWVFAVGLSDFAVSKHPLSEWIGEAELNPDRTRIPCDDARMAWAVLLALREDCFLWQCGACNAWVFTSNRPRIGVLECSTCSAGGVDFRHADRHVGGEAS